MITISVGESRISIPISSRLEICYKEKGQEIIVNGRVVMQHIKAKIKIRISS